MGLAARQIRQTTADREGAPPDMLSMETKMKAALFAAMMVLTGASAVQADDAPASKQVCLRTIDILNTTTPDDKTIIFHMNNGKVWRNDLRGSCNGLKFNGFAYAVTPPDQICGNLQIIHVLRTHAVCSLGAFTEVPKAPPPSHM